MRAAAGRAVSVVGLPGLPRAVFLLLLVILCCCFDDLRSDAQKLPQHEVEALKQIAAKLKVPATLWNFTSGVDPCRDWVPSSKTKYVISNLTCECNTTTKDCHLLAIQLTGQNLTGVLPEEFGNLTSLIQIDLTRNYINGTIPAAAWASLPLRNLSLMGNRLSGAIPEAIGNITALEWLVLEDNMLQGPLPRGLGNLTSLTRLLLAANNFTGELPETLGNLKNLTDFRIDGNDISGKIPGFIGNWTNLKRFDMQGTSLEGPFPPIFSTLQNLAELRVSDLKKTDGSFPPIQNMRQMRHLVLRNCSISGQIPPYIGTMPRLRILDLSFNNLTGVIPSNFVNLRDQISKMYLTNNKLTGSIPLWIRESIKKLDLSSNTFTDTTSAPKDCHAENQNFIESFSSTQSNSIDPCLRKGLPCRGKAKNYQIFINCGGTKETVDGIQYEEDTSRQGSSTYFLSDSGKWAYSSTGAFVSDADRDPGYIAENTSILIMPNQKLYMSARLSPLSLKYYGLCLQNGNYTIKLHFAEIIFTNDQTFLSVGRRVFDVSIQGKKVLKDFNIAEEANGAGKEIIKNFTALVESNTLEIHFQWSGKGTNGIPYRGVYGPLISAISVTPDFKPELDKKFPTGAIVGLVVASCVLAMLSLIFLWFCLRRKKIENNEFRGLELQTGYFSLKQIKAATGNFDPLNKIGEGGFGPVYKGVLPDGFMIAVKQLSSKSKQGNREFVNEIGMISALQHPNLAKLFGCCIEGNQLLLIYEFMENNSLARALFGSEGMKLKLDWQTRHKICLGIARGLAYLHEESILKIVHRDIKATNILLDKDLNARISDFGLAKLDEADNSHISTRIAGTMGYMAPEYAMRGYLTDKADVYSFGVVTLEIVSGKSNTNYQPTEDLFCLLDWALDHSSFHGQFMVARAITTPRNAYAVIRLHFHQSQAYVLQEQGRLLELVDPSLGTNYSAEEAQQMLNLALLCTNPSPTLRPAMSTVVSMLEGEAPVGVPSVKHAGRGSVELRSRSFEKLSHDSQRRSMSIDGPCYDSSLSMHSSKADTTSHSPAGKLLSDYSE